MRQLHSLAKWHHRYPSEGERKSKQVVGNPVLELMVSDLTMVLAMYLGEDIPDTNCNGNNGADNVHLVKREVKIHCRCQQRSSSEVQYTPPGVAGLLSSSPSLSFLLSDLSPSLVASSLPFLSCCEKDRLYGSSVKDLGHSRRPSGLHAVSLSMV